MADLLAISERLQPLARAIDDILREVGGEKMAFLLIVSTFGEPHQIKGDETQYVSNIQREDAIKLLESQLAHFKNRPADMPLHKKRQNPN